MRIFPSSSPFDADVEKVTPEEDKGEDWAKILDICDKVGTSCVNARDCLKSIVKRLNNPNPHVVLKATVLLDACVNNCSKVFQLEIASREFETEYRKLLRKYSQSCPKIADKLKSLLKKWAENDFKSDPQLNLIPSMYAKLKQEGVDFSSNPETKSTSSQMPKDPNAVTSQQEVDDIAKAIELSLKETNKSATQSNLYPAATLSSSFSNRTFTNSALKQSKQVVKALYDFEAAEDNELTFYAGEIIEVLDDSDKNWWKGVNHRGEGLFPANFVTSDVSSSSDTNSESESTDVSLRKTRVRFSDTVGASSAQEFKQEEAVINEQKIDRLLHLLHEANPTDESTDTEEMIAIEEEVNAMGPLIDAELEIVDRKHAQLTQLSSNLVDALNLYHSLMREPYHTMPSAVKGPPYMMQPMPVHGVPHPHQMMYNGGMNGPTYNIPGPMMNEHFPPPNAMTNASNMPPGAVHQPPPHLFAPITSVPVQSDGNFHHQSMMQHPPPPPNAAPPNHPYQSLPPNMVPIPYQVPQGPMGAQQMPPQMNLYQSMPHAVPSHDASSANLQNH